MTPTITTNRIRNISESDKEILTHPGSRIFLFYFSLMCLVGFLYLLVSKEVMQFTIVCGFAGFVGITLSLCGYKLSKTKENKIEHDPAFEAIDSTMQQHISTIQKQEHKKIMIKIHLLTPLLLLLFATPIIGSITLISALKGLESGNETISIPKLIIAIVCFAYFIGFIIIGLVFGATSGKSKIAPKETETIVQTEGVVLSSIATYESTNGKVYRERIAIRELNHSITAFTKNESHKRGEKVNIEYIKENPKECRIIT